MRDYLLSAAAVIALMTSGAAAHDKPATLIQGLGDHHHTISTAQSDAQRYFDQGLILTFAFNHAEAIRAIVDARIAEQKGDLEKAVNDLGVAVAMQDRLAYNEPADWHYPVRESLGAALLLAGRAQEAEAVFRADLKKNPRGGRSLFGLCRALEAQGKSDEAALVRQEFNDAWRTAQITPSLDTM